MTDDLMMFGFVCFCIGFIAALVVTAFLHEKNSK